MISVNGYFDGNVCIPLEYADIKPNQKVIITVLDDFTINVPQKKYPNRRAGIAKDPNFYMPPDFNEPLDCFKEYM